MSTPMASRTLDILAADGGKYLARIRTALEASQPDVNEVRRAARQIHHRAMLADHDSAIRAAATLQRVALRVSAGETLWSADLADEVRQTVAALGAVIEALPARAMEAEGRLDGAAERLAALAGRVPRVPRAGPDLPGTAPAAPPRSEADELLAALAEDLETAVERLGSDPRDREPLKATLRRIRRLRELGRVGADTPADKALGAVEEVILQIADLNATVGPGHLTVFSNARGVIGALRAEQEVAPDQLGGRAVEVDRLKDEVMAKARRARVVVWVSDLFYPEGPHIVDCPIAAQSGGVEPYFLSEARRRLERCQQFHLIMRNADAEQMRLAGESLSNTLRHLRERAAAFDHPEFGRIARRTAAALRAQLVRPASRLRGLAAGLSEILTALRTYLETSDAEARGTALAAAEAALQRAVFGAAQRAEAEAGEPADVALERALALRARVEARLRALTRPEAKELRSDLEELFELLAYFASAGAAQR